ncbi:MBL fold metallo-hydrolase [Bacillus piscicola]|uniref:MBL fold metallo-hydrolase n=1 Tax=Bacillus piscicola TaxID=1632684 RepID=UPI001F0971DC|nr:MBL fold metallo-hydrolase [Bacillus piscicola]
MSNTYIPMTSVASGAGQPVMPDVYCFTTQIVNVAFIGTAKEPHDWVLVDTGMPKSADNIINEANACFGENSHPKAIILTHGHFDHVGSIMELVKKWDVPVYAHEKELPYLTGQSSYPEPDPTVEGGTIAKISAMFPDEPVNLGARVKKLPADGTIPGLPEWRWYHTPGHTPGHISLFRDKDRMLIAGDAFITVKQDELYKVFTQEKEFQGPPRYFTTDWEASFESVKKLNALHPSAAITGHGWPTLGEELTDGLDWLVKNFEKVAVPDHGRYVHNNK